MAAQTGTAAELNAKQARFVQEYIVDLNATQAAIRAGYSEKTAHSQGQRLLKNVGIAEAISKAQEQRGERTQITADRVLKELARIGLSDLRQAFDEQGNLKRPADWDDELAAAVSSVEVVARNSGDGAVEYVHKLKMWDKNTALANIAKHFGMFIERHEHTGKDGEPLQAVVVLPAKNGGN